jgi:hypothetical protein
MASATRVACNEEGDGNCGKSNGNEGGGGATAMRVMVTEGEQQSTSNGIDKGGRWLARDRRQGNHATTTVGDNE